MRDGAEIFQGVRSDDTERIRRKPWRLLVCTQEAQCIEGGRGRKEESREIR